jgi:hypothetical protein
MLASVSFPLAVSDTFSHDKSAEAYELATVERASSERAKRAGIGGRRRQVGSSSSSPVLISTP